MVIAGLCLGAEQEMDDSCGVICVLIGALHRNVAALLHLLVEGGELAPVPHDDRVSAVDERLAAALGRLLLVGPLLQERLTERRV
jgi:hypothetical protein